MSYETDPAGLGVGKRYGPLHLGGVQGAMKGEGAFTEAIFEISFDELDASGAQVVSLPPYAQVVEVAAEVTEVFGTGDTCDIKLDGTTVLGATKIVVSSLGVVTPALSGTAAAYTVGATAEDLTIDVALIDAGTPLTGKAKISVRYRAL